MLLCDATWPQVEAYLKDKDTLLVPIGSTEQHGPTGLIGTDYLTSQSITEEAAGRLGVYSAPPVCYGMAQHHMAFAGSASLKPSTFILYIKDLAESFIHHGFKRIIFVNGHGGNAAPLTTAFSEIKDHGVDVMLKTLSWYTFSQIQKYEEEHFADQNGFHATCGEVSVTMHLREQAFTKIESKNFDIERPIYSHPMSPTEFRMHFPDGRMMSNPGLATKEHGQNIHEIAVSAVCENISHLMTIKL